MRGLDERAALGCDGVFSRVSGMAAACASDLPSGAGNDVGVAATTSGAATGTAGSATDGITTGADSTGAAAFNRKLSENRARSVASHLVARGVPQASVTSVGLGSSDPIASNDTADGRAKNRRVELQIVPDESKAQ